MYVRGIKNVFSIHVVACILAEIRSQRCLTPNGETATCISLYRCPALVSALATQNENAIEFVRQSECTTHPLVCCRIHAAFDLTPTVIKENRQKQSVSTHRGSVFPDPRLCGLQHTDDRFYNDSNAALDEFPWLALINYMFIRSGKEGGFRCGGSLISKRYVLTAGHCLNPPSLVPISVRLGEYNFKKDVDCVINPDYPECNDLAVDIEIEAVILHEEFFLRNSTNDIGLLRLNRNVQFTDYVRPICLPLPGVKLAGVGDFLFASGFVNPQMRKPANTDSHFLERKKRGKVELISNTECMQFYNAKRFQKIITSGHMCGREYDDFSCQADAGIPLMIANKHRWHQEGIVSYALGCGPGTVTVYTRVTEYLEWMQNKMRL